MTRGAVETRLGKDADNFEGRRVEDSGDGTLPKFRKPSTEDVK